jgi:hypothetical protein
MSFPIAVLCVFFLVAVGMLQTTFPAVQISTHNLHTDTNTTLAPSFSVISFFCGIAFH